MSRPLAIPKQTLIVALAMILLAAAAAAYVLTAGPTMAQTDPYPDPQPCGPANEPFEPAETITIGHYGVFDGYWDFDEGTLNLNLCPPSVVHMEETHTDPTTGVETTEEVSTRSSSNVDVRRSVFHLDGTGFQHTLTATDLDNYRFFKLGDGDDAGTEDDAIGQTIWWLRTGDDMLTPSITETASPLQMGFSTGLLDSKYWYLDDGIQSARGLEPLQYELEVIREPGIPIDEQGHVYVFDESDEAGAAHQTTARWDSSEPDTNALSLYPGEYHHFQWAFTKPGTYVISVQLKGQVRTEDDPRPAGVAADWAPISENIVETTEVREYVFQVGPLTLNHEPIFEVERMVAENADAGTAVGDPIPVYQGDSDPLTFDLSGPGHSLFSVAADANGDAQIRVAGDLDYEERTEYRLTLGVSDNKDHERNTDASVDNRISVKINIKDLVDRTISEDAPDDAPVGDPIVVAHDVGDNLSYSLSGTYSDRFTVAADDNGNAQITLAGFEWIDYEILSKYRLTLHVTGYADPSEDHDIEVVVLVADVPETLLRATLFYQGESTLTTGESATLWVESGDLPEGAAIDAITWTITNVGTGEMSAEDGSDNRLVYTPEAAAKLRFEARLDYVDSNGMDQVLNAPQSFTITWADPPSDPPGDNPDGGGGTGS